MPRTKEPQTNDENNTLFAPSSKEAAIQNEEKKSADQKKLNIYQKMQIAKVEVQAQVKGKSGKNEYSGFDYLQLEDFLPVTNKVFRDIGLFSQFFVLTNTDSNGVQTDIAYLIIINSDNPEEKLKYSSKMADAVIKGNSPIQLLGGAHTYMRRYLYVEALDLSVPDALDSQVGSGNIESTKQGMSAQTLGILKNLCMEMPDRVDGLLKNYKVQKIGDLTQDQAVEAIRTLQIRKARMNNGNGDQGAR